MNALIFVGGICLGSCGGFLLALLVVHGRAASLAEEMVASQNRMKAHPGVAALRPEAEAHTARRNSYAPAAAAAAPAASTPRTPLRTPVRASAAEISAAGVSVPSVSAGISAAGWVK